MDKLRALQYFRIAASAQSYSAAARHFDVSPAAVAKLVAALEAALGVKLFDRHGRGLHLTTAGQSYLDACQGALQQLELADEQARATTLRAKGTVVVGVQPVIAQECLTAALPRFQSLYPDIQLDLRFFSRPIEEQTRGLDVMLLLGWQSAGDLVQRRIGATSFVVCAAPSYWQQHGMPQHPSELAQHNCLCVRTAYGAVMDLWRFRRGHEEVEVTARGSMVFDNVHRDMARDLIVAGVGVGRILEWDTRRGQVLGGGTLVPALTDWENLEVPPVNLLYPPSVRRVPRVRVFIDFVTQLFQDLEAIREHRLPATAQPEWSKRLRTRASSVRRPV